MLIVFKLTRGHSYSWKGAEPSQVPCWRRVAGWTLQSLLVEGEGSRYWVAVRERCPLECAVVFRLPQCTILSTITFSCLPIVCSVSLNWNIWGEISNNRVFLQDQGLYQESHLILLPGCNTYSLCDLAHSRFSESKVL